MNSQTVRKLIRENDYCVYCSKKLKEWEKQISYFLPFVKTKENLFVCCEECGKTKGNKFFMTIESARDYIQREKELQPNPEKQCEKCGKIRRIKKSDNVCYQCKNKGKTVFQELNIKTTILTEVRWRKR